MKSKLKRLLVFLIILGMVIGLLPTTAFADLTDATSITLTKTDGTIDPKTPIIPADMTENTISASDGSWTYTKDTNTLTLNNWSGQRITANGSFNLHLIGNNTITLNDEYNAKGIEVTTSQYVYVGVNMTAASGGKLTIKSPTGGLNNGFYGIYFEIESCGTFNIKSGELLIDISGSMNDWSYGIRGGLEFKGKTSDIAKATVRLSNTRDSGSDGLVGFYKLIIEDEDNIEVDVNVTANGANRACTGINYMNVHNTNAKIKVVADNTATDDLTKENAVYTMYNTSLKQGGKIETTGRVAFREYFTNDQYPVFIFGKNTKTTLPADNKLLTLEKFENGNRIYVYSDISGEPLKQMVVEYSADVADFEWLGGSLTIPDGTLKVGELYTGEYFHQYLRGFERLEHVRFEVTSGELPKGLRIDGRYISGRPTEPCEARTVTITATDNRGTSSDTTDDRTQSFDVIIGEVSDVDKFITIGTDAPFDIKTSSKSGTGWSWNGSNQTLTLNNYNGGPIKSDAGFNLHLIGNNTITLNDEYSAKGIEVTTSQYVYVGVNMTATSGGKLTIKSPTGGLNNGFYGIYFEIESCGTFNIKSGELLIDISGSMNDWSYGIRGGLEFKGKTTDIAKATVRLSNTRDSGTDGLVGFYKLIIEDEDNIEVDVNVTANGANRACTGINYMNVHNTNAKIKVVADNTATDDLTKENAVYTMYNTSLKQGGKIETTGRVAFREYFYSDNYPVFIFGKNTKTTLPADNKLLTLEKFESGNRIYVYSDISGEPLKQMVVEYSADVADFEWLGGSLTIPDGTLKVGELYTGEYFHQYLRGFERLEHVRFEVTSGELPKGLRIDGRYISGRPTEPCEARTVTITATDNRGTSSDTTDDRTQSFNVVLGNVRSVKPVAAVIPAETNVSMEMNSTKNIEVSVTPADASYPDLRLTNSNTNVVYASVSTPDTATGKSTVTLTSRGVAGTATIEVISKETAVKSTINVTVNAAETTITGTKDGMSSAALTQAELIVGHQLDLLSLVQLSVAKYQNDIDFAVEDAGTTGAAVTNKKLNASNSGVVKIKATFGGKDLNGDGVKEYSEANYSFYVKTVNKTAVSIDGNKVIAGNATGSGAVLVVTSYDSGGKLIDIKIINISSDSTVSKSFSEIGLKQTGAVKVKAMLWNNLSAMKPLALPAERDL